MRILITLISSMAILLIALPGPLYKYAVIDLGTAVVAMAVGLVAGMVTLLLLGVQFLFKRDTVKFNSALTAAIFSTIAIIIPLSMLNTAKNVPPIHDISTDLVNPPKFIAIAPLRANAPNPVGYAGTETAAQQRQGYPELQTLSYHQSKFELLNSTKQAIDNLGWELVNIDADTGIIEATDTTLWFGFKDDIVIRVTDNGSKRLGDIRSKSRVGSSDLGKNAARIHDFIDELDDVLAE